MTVAFAKSSFTRNNSNFKQYHTCQCESGFVSRHHLSKKILSKLNALAVRPQMVGVIHYLVLAALAGSCTRPRFGTAHSQRAYQRRH